MDDDHHHYGEDYGPPERSRRCVCTDDMSPKGGCPGPDVCQYGNDQEKKEEEENEDDEPPEDMARLYREWRP
jgi:hypothetical protein